MGAAGDETSWINLSEWERAIFPRDNPLWGQT